MYWPLESGITPIQGLLYDVFYVCVVLIKNEKHL